MFGSAREHRLVQARKMQCGSRSGQQSRGNVANIMGMVQVAGRTYRIERRGSALYQVIRILDDVAIGFFASGARLDLLPAGTECKELREVALAAVRVARTAWAPSKRVRSGMPA